MILYYILVPFAWLLWHIGFRIHVEGRENLKKVQTKGCILAPVETEKEAEEVSAGQEGQESEAAENQKPNGGLHADEHLPDKSKVISSSDQKNTDEPAAQEYVFPPLSLLHTDGPVHAKQDDIQHKAKIIESTLASFGVGAKVINASVGPTVTRFELKPEIGVRVSKIEGL